MNQDQRYAEQDLVDHVVKELSIRHTSIPLTTDNFLQNMRELIQYHDMPVYTISYYVHWLLMRAISQNGYKISISGTGADELFSGYYDHHLLYLSTIRDDSMLYEESVKNWEHHIKPLVRNPFLKDSKRFIEDPSFRDHIFLGADRFSGFLKRAWSEPFFEEKHPTNLLRMRMLNELFHESVPIILHEDDLNAMYYSLENRSPFLDRELCQFSLRIPTRYLIQKGYAKRVLREAMRGIIPEKILTCRRKVGFNAPLGDLIDFRNRTVRAQILDDGPIYEYVHRNNLEEMK